MTIRAKWAQIWDFSKVKINAFSRDMIAIQLTSPLVTIQINFYTRGQDFIKTQSHQGRVTVGYGDGVGSTFNTDIYIYRFACYENDEVLVNYIKENDLIRQFMELPQTKEAIIGYLFTKEIA
jgi:hypothetical protein